jgi:hypothetical protein
MCQFYVSGVEKRAPAIIAPDLHEAWLSADQANASELMNWTHTLELRTISAIRHSS